VTNRKITLGGKEFEIRPIDLGTMKRIGLGSAKMTTAPSNDPVAREGAWYDGTFEVLAAGLGKTVEEVLAIEDVTLQDLLAANRVIFEVTGLVTEKANNKKGGRSPGEDGGAATG
jgi:hypothetical protein